MALSINTNTVSMNAQRHLAQAQSSLSQAMERLSSGLRINSSKDDPAGLAIAQRMSMQVKGMTVANRNANDAISMLQTAEGGMAVLAGHLQRMNELATQAASGQYSTTDRAKLDAEFFQLGAEIQRSAANTTFNGKSILGSDAGAFSFQIGPGTSAHDRISFTTSDLASTLFTTGDVATSDSALAAMSNIAMALDRLSTSRAQIGAYMSRFDGVVSQLATSIENTEAARSRIMDADYARETAALARASILQQAATAMVAQANSIPRNILSLLQ